MQVSAASSLAVITLTLGAGFAAGLWYGGTLNQSASQVPGVAATVESARKDSASSVSPREVPTEPPSTPGAADDEATLSQLLEAHQFREATAFYYNALRTDPGKMPLLRPTVDGYVRRCFEHCNDETFTALVDAWLATFYDDIPILTTLAEYEAQQGYPEASANTLLLARTYALRPADQRAVTRALQRLTLGTDERLSDQQRWIELVGYYEFLAAIDFTIPEFELRRALLYQHLGELTRGTALLSDLRAADDGKDPQWTATLEQHLADTAVETVPGVDLTDAIPLEQRGEGYIVEVVINDEATLKLLVDTGASMTALSRDSFRRLNRPGFSLLGTRLFDTANGYTRGDIYLAASLVLGDERIEGTNVAVLDFPGMDDIDGLLGMNVLRQFRFEIDQSLKAMYISRRQ